MSERRADAAGGLAHNVRHVASLDIPGGGQVIVRGGYAYVGHMRPPNGTSIIDVRDPAQPRLVAEIPPPSGYSHAHKVRVVGNLLYANVERDNRHFYRKGERIGEVEADLKNHLGRAPTEGEIAGEIGVAEAEMAELRTGFARGYDEGGFRIFDISDVEHPRELVHQRTGGIGVHRFDVDERYAYISTEMEGYVGNILVIYDVSDPTAPQEISRWWMPGQHVAGGETPTWKGQRHRLHHALRDGDRLWAACWHAGARLVDISDIRNPKTAGSFAYQPPFPEPTHTFMRVPNVVDGREIAVIADEQHETIPGQPPAFLWVLDVTDPGDIRALSTFHVSALDTPYADQGGRFGLHQFAEQIDGTLLYTAWFSAGLRIIDIANPTLPQEVASYVPAPVGDQPAPQANDVALDENGLIYMIDRHRGLHVLEYER